MQKTADQSNSHTS